MAKKKDSVKSGAKLIVLAICVVIGIIVHYFYPELIERIGGLDQDIGTVSTPADGTHLTVHYIDVGQGDAEMVVSPNGDVMLIDAGPNSSEDKLCEYISLCGVKTIKYLVLTHPHEDHIGGADKVINSFKVENVIMPDVTSGASTYKRTLEAIEKQNCNLIIANPKDQYTLDTAVFTILGPIEIDKSDLNNCSIVMRLDFGKDSFIFTADAEAKSEKLMLSELPESYFKADVLKVGHHGSSTSTSDEFLKAISPSAAVISCGKDNEYGHPHSETVKKLDKMNVKYYRTDILGTVKITSDGENLSVGG